MFGKQNSTSERHFQQYFSYIVAVSFLDVMKFVCDRSVIFSGYSGLLHQENWRPRYNWNIVESGIKHHNPNPQQANTRLDLILTQFDT